MKKLVVTSFLIVLSIVVSAQKVIENPGFGIRNQSYVNITKIELNNDATILSFKLTASEGTRVGIADSSYIQVVGHPDTLFMTKKEAPDTDPTGWYIVPEEGLSYRLFFPPIDPGVAYIDFGEPVANAWKIYDIKINKPDNHSIISEKLLGNWFSQETGEWTLSLLDSLAILDNKVWEYISVKPNGEAFQITLKNNNEKKNIICWMEEAENCSLKTENEDVVSLSKNTALLKKYTNNESFGKPIFQTGKVNYSGIIKGFTTRLGINTGFVRFINPLNNQLESQVIKIEKNGSFTVDLTLDFPILATVSLPSGAESIFLEPGKNIFHLVNSGDSEWPSFFMGESASINYGLRATGSVATPTLTFIEGTIEMTDKEYLNHVLKIKNDELEKLKNIQNEQNISDKAVQIRMLDIEFRAARNVIIYNQNIALAKSYANQYLKKEEQHSLETREFDLGLLRIIKDVPFNNELAITSSEFFSFLQRVKYTDFEHPRNTMFYLLVEMEDSLKQRGTELSGEEKDMIQFIRLNLLDNYNENFLENFSVSYNKVLQNFRQREMALYEQISNHYTQSLAEKNVQIIFGDSGSLVLDYLALQTYLTNLYGKVGVNEEEFNKVKKNIKSNDLKEIAFASYYKKKAETEARNTSTKVELKTDADKIFDSIINKFRGKVVYVDFWATWCAPCRSGIERIRPLKKELAGEDIVFVYITNPTSPENDYKKLVPDIKGEHFRLSSDEWNFLIGKFNIVGIPHYALVDKNGKIVNPHLPHLTNEPLKNMLLDLAKE